MSSCGYYTCNKGKSKCTHPTYGVEYTKIWHGAELCNLCRRRCGGIYPSSLPKEDISNCKIEILDKDGKVIVEI